MVGHPGGSDEPRHLLGNGISLLRRPAAGADVDEAEHHEQHDGDGQHVRVTGFRHERHTLPAGLYRFELHEGSTNVATLASAQIGSGGGGGSASASSPAPLRAVLSLDVAVCKDGADVAGYVGQWVMLPGQGDCSLPGKAGVTLLGWSTSAAFPVAVAQRQADKGWGAYEITDELGNVTAVLIPAGHEAFVTGSNTLYPIWSA